MNNNNLHHDSGIVTPKDSSSLHNREDLFETVMLSMSDAVFITDNRGRFTFICPNVDVMFGYSYEEVERIGNISKLLGDDICNKVSLNGSGELINIEHSIKDKNNLKHDLLINVKRVSINGGTLLYSCRDISDRKKMENDIRKTKDELEQLVKERTANLSSTVQLLKNEISEREKAEKNQLKEKLFSDHVINSLPGIFYLFDNKGNMLRWNKNFIKITGYTTEETEKLHFMDLFCENDRSTLTNQLHEVLQNETSSCEATFLTKDGKQHPYFCTAKRITIDTETFIVGTGIDISRRKEAEQDLKKSEAKLADAQKLARIGNWDWNIGTNELWWSDEIYRIFGIDSTNFTATYDTFLEAVHPDDRDLVIASVNEALKSNKPYSIDHRVIRPDGTELIVHEEGKVSFDDSGRPSNMMGTVQDITDRTIADERLKRNYRLLDAITRTQSQFITDVSSRTLFNELLKDFISLTGSEYGFIGEILYTSHGAPYLKTHTISNIAWNEETEAFYAAHVENGMEFLNLDTLFGEVISTGKPVIFHTRSSSGRQAKLPEGHPPLHCFLGLPLYKVNKLVGMVGLANCSGSYDDASIEYLQPLLSTCGNIIEEYRKEQIHREAERALAESEERFKGIVDNINIGVTLISPDRKILLLNKRMRIWFPNITEHKDNICNSTFRHLDTHDKCYNCPTSRTLKDGKVHEQAIDIPRDGETKNYRIISSPIKNNRGEIISVIELLEDITEQKKLKEQLLHVQKMDSIGTLAGGVAHDFNNIITAIIGFTSVLTRRMKDNDPARLYVEQIQTAAEHASNLTSSLLTFSRKQKLNPISVNLNDIVKKMEKFLLRIIGEDIEFSMRTVPDDLIVMADINQIEQVLLNLAGNARDAMPNGGLLDIQTGKVTFTADFIESHGYGTPGEYAAIYISDTGTGMDEQTREKIFEPFYTTKEVNKGTGLGLSIVYGIIKQHNGYISVESNPGMGTKFIIYLPIKQVRSTHNNPELSDADNLISGSETVLVAEDDTMIRNIISSELKEFGYNVITAVNGQDALSKFIEYHEEIDCVLLDMIMPKKNGKDVYDEIMATYPDMKIIFLSGYSSEIVALSKQLHHDPPFISKPVKPEVLMKTIRELFDTG